MRNGEQEQGHVEGSVWKGLVAGVAGGLVASWVMEEFQALWSKLEESLEGSEEGGGSEGVEGKSQGVGEEQEPATVKAAEAISENVFDHELTKKEKDVAGPAVHYAMGAGSAALYGVMAEFVPEVTTGAGVPFGTAVWLLADEAAVPALGLSKGPAEYPLSKHVYALASHFVYGLTTEIVRSNVRRML
jgi:putative membrane protein